MAELLRVENLKSGYGEAVVVQGVSLVVEKGRSLALLGRNGTGKTTLLNTLVGATRHHAGRIVLDGVDLTTMPSFRRAAAGIGWVPQERFESGLRRTVQWYLEHKAWTDSVTSGAYRHWIEANYHQRDNNQRGTA